MAVRKTSHHHVRSDFSNPLGPIKTILLLCLTFSILEIVLVEGMELLAGGSKASTAGSRLTGAAGHATNLADTGRPGEQTAFHTQHGGSLDSTRDLKGAPANPTAGQHFDPVAQPQIALKKDKGHGWFSKLKSMLKDMFSFNWTRRFFRWLWHGDEEPYHYEVIPHGYAQPYLYPGHSVPPRYVFPPGHISRENAPETYIGSHNHKAYIYLRDKPITTPLPNSAHMTHVEYLPGFIQTYNYIKPGDNSLFRALAEIKYHNQESHMHVQTEIFDYMKDNRHKFQHLLPDNGKDYSTRVFDYINALAHQTHPPDDLVLAAFAESNKYNLAFVSDTKPSAFAGQYRFNPSSHEYRGIILNGQNYDLLRSFHGYGQPYVHPRHIFPPGSHITPENAPYVPIGDHNRVAHQHLSRIKVATSVPDSVYTTPVEYLPGYIRTHDYIQKGEESFFRALSAIKWPGNQEGHLLIKGEIIKYMQNNPEKFNRFLPNNGMEYESKVLAHVNMSPQQRQALGVGYQLETAAFAEKNKLNVAFVADTQPDVSAFTHHFDTSHPGLYCGIILNNHNFELLKSL
ncbi:hypothetical protein PGTUg99_010548 [Puccinia graminis f. sp. tritici]|uniref:Uncharacterized protein n=1 Tax=Puccinia graminis f. sp. tritici TaxID=56615 RepID=A0A5B0R5G0_PUCGR|nr:hypothetical protein PGTUg99_010548 [Puccinia graminis f. sp. tritici]